MAAKGQLIGVANDEIDDEYVVMDLVNKINDDVQYELQDSNPPQYV